MDQRYIYLVVNYGWYPLYANPLFAVSHCKEVARYVGCYVCRMYSGFFLSFVHLGHSWGFVQGCSFVHYRIMSLDGRECEM